MSVAQSLLSDRTGAGAKGASEGPISARSPGHAMARLDEDKGEGEREREREGDSERERERERERDTDDTSALLEEAPFRPDVRSAQLLFPAALYIVCRR